jgi:hypothetical protein
MNEYTVDNARKIYCEIADIKIRYYFIRRLMLHISSSADYRIEIKDLRDQIYSKTTLLRNYPWYVRIWARLTYKI